MNKEDFEFEGADGFTLQGTRFWTEPEVAVVQVIHGMAEHRKRYEEFGKILTDRGISVYTYDQRGHGDSAEANDQSLGHFAHRDGWDKVVRDAFYLTKFIKKRKGDSSVILFGHSMGSFIARDYVTQFGEEVTGAIFSGTSMLDPLTLKLITPVAKLEKLFRGKLGKSKIMERIIFSSNNRNVEEAETKFDWLTRDREIVEKYIEDELSGFSCTTGFYDDFVYGMKRVSDEGSYELIPDDLPLLFVSGGEDPVGGPIIEDLAENYSQAGVKDVEYMVYPGARHELINELNKDQVFSDLIAWIEDRING